MKITERMQLWDNYRQLANKLWGDVEEDLHYHFAPIHASHDDEDTPAIKILFDMLADLNGFISEHLDNLEFQFSLEAKHLSAETV